VPVSCAGKVFPNLLVHKAVNFTMSTCTKNHDRSLQVLKKSLKSLFKTQGMTKEWGTCFIIDGAESPKDGAANPKDSSFSSADRVHFSTGFIQKKIYRPSCRFFIR
jgi:hypothetical protein